MGEGDTVRAFRITGMVQGVGFRWWTRSQAEALGVRGTVRNCADGSVEVLAAANPEALERFRSVLAEGPPGARVEAVTEGHPGDGSLPSGFEILL